MGLVTVSLMPGMDLLSGTIAVPDVSVEATGQEGNEASGPQTLLFSLDSISCHCCSSPGLDVPLASYLRMFSMPLRVFSL